MMRTTTTMMPAVLAAGAALGVLAATTGAPPPAPAAPEVAPAPMHSLAGLAWLTGTWRQESDGRVHEETWSAPLGDAMVGTFCAVRDGHAGLYELLIIEQEETGPVLRLKHFNRHLVGWEAQGEAVAWPLAELTEHEAVFRQETEAVQRFTYRRDGEDVLHLTVEVDHDGEPATYRFRMTRVK